jgi:transcriptional regulator with XRE-family HTH domain
MPSRDKSPLTHLCRAIRTARNLSQEELAALAGVDVSTLKNAEGNRSISVSTLATIYRQGLTGQLALTEEQWHDLLAAWIARDLPPDVTVSAPKLAAALEKHGTASAGAKAQRHADLLRAVEDLASTDAALILDLVKAIAGKKGPTILTLLRALRDLK